jgi:hypothetical protein
VPFARPSDACPWRVWKVADEFLDSVSREFQVGVDDPRVPPGLRVDRPGQAKSGSRGVPSVTEVKSLERPLFVPLRTSYP